MGLEVVELVVVGVVGLEVVESVVVGVVVGVLVPNLRRVGNVVWSPMSCGVLLPRLGEAKQTG